MLLDNIPIARKITLVAIIIGLVAIAGSIFSSLAMNRIGASYSALILNEEKAALNVARGERAIVDYMAAAFSLGFETTDEGNLRLEKIINATIADYAAVMKTARDAVPASADRIDRTAAVAEALRASCAPLIKAALATTDLNLAMEQGQRMKQICEPLLGRATAAQAMLADTFRTAAESAAADLEARTRETILTNLAALSAGLVLSFLLAFWITRATIVTPLTRLAEAMRRLADRDLTVTIPDHDRRDEIGLMARTVAVFKTSALEVETLRAEQAAQETRAAEAQKQALHQMADAFEAKVMGVVTSVSSASDELQTTAESMTSTAAEANAQAVTVASAAEQTSANVQTVASATEELHSSIAEIGRQVADAADIARAASDKATKTDTLVHNLSEAADRIGAVVQLITNIAGQTNLLALNATIEAARAGDAGRGFAVVAGEVKELATQTAKATDDIGRQIAAVQGETEATVFAILEIAVVIGQIQAISAAIAAAVTQQGAATSEIARNVQEASKGTQGVSDTIGGVSQSAAATGAAAHRVLTSAEKLTHNAGHLKREVQDFLASVRRA